MRVYPKYRFSDIRWFREIPNDWGLEKIKFQGNVVSGSTPETSKPEFWEGEIIWATPVDFGADNQKHIYTSGRKITKEGLRSIGGKLVPKGAVVISSRAPIGLVGLAGVDLVTNQGCKSVIPKKINGEYLFFCLKEFSTVLENLGNETIFAELSLNTLKNFSLPVPSLPEQQNIVHFLDYKTWHIDTFITNRQKQIELLKEQKTAIINKAVNKGINPNAKMKPSGIEWIGDIPERWVVTKVKFVGKVKGRIGFRGYAIADLVDEGEGALTLGATHINKEGEIDLTKPVFIRWDKYYESPEIMVEKDDILVVQRGSIGVVGIVNSEIGFATINPSLTILKKVKMNRHLLFLQLRSKIVKEAIITIFNETAVPMLSQNQISNFYILLPPSIEEQQSIIDFISEETSTIDSLIAKYQKQIDLMQEYRASLISQTVTGKIDVREWQPKAKKYRTEQLPISIAAEK